MTTSPACQRFRELAPELALGVLDGDERAAALDHLATCIDCRAFTDDLTEVGDALLLLAPSADPPLGFESRVLERLSSQRPAQRRERSPWLRALGIAAAAAVVTALLTISLTTRGDGDHLLRATLASTRSGDAVGRVWAYDSDRAWMFMTIDNPWAADNPYVCEAVLDDGRVVRLGRFQAHEGKGAWGEPVDVAIGEIAAVRLVTDSGTVVATANLD